MSRSLERRDLIAEQEDEGRTHAEARLHTDDATHLIGRASARRNPTDRAVPESAAELALARVLSYLAHPSRRWRREPCARSAGTCRPPSPGIAFLSGGLTLSRSLLKAGLVDRFRVVVLTSPPSGGHPAT
jgi:riboflavin biosynthesis pyrimidine reductase